jgi:hypothetical protein
MSYWDNRRDNIGKHDHFPSQILDPATGGAAIHDPTFQVDIGDGPMDVSLLTIYPDSVDYVGMVEFATSYDAGGATLAISAYPAFISSDGDPSSAGGVDGPKGTILAAPDGSTVWIKTGDAKTAWTQITVVAPE